MTASNRLTILRPEILSALIHTGYVVVRNYFSVRLKVMQHDDGYIGKTHHNRLQSCGPALRVCSENMPGLPESDQEYAQSGSSALRELFLGIPRGSRTIDCSDLYECREHATCMNM